MAEDPVSNLLRRHFQRVQECLQDKNNLDILTGFRFRSSSDKAIDNDQFDTEDEHQLTLEFEFAGEKPGKCLTTAPKTSSDTSIEDIESEEFQAETDFEEELSEGKTIGETSSSLCNSPLDDYEEHIEQSQSKPRGKSLLERPETPMLNMYDSDDESVEYQAKPRKMEGSQKFILYREQFQAGDLDFPPKTKDLSEEKKIDRPEVLEILPRREEPKTRLKLATPEETEKAFHKELEMYKKDIKLEKTIQSLSCGTNLHHQTTLKRQPQSCSCDQCLKTIRQDEEPRDKFKDSRLETSLGLEKNASESLKKYFEEANTNVCRKVSKSEIKNIEQTKFHVNDDVPDDIFEKNFKNPTLNENSQSAHHEEKNYLTMNHLKIQKEMMKRIEDMYKTGDGK